MANEVLDKLIADKYRVKSLIAEGESGDLYAAHNEIVDSAVTLKILPQAFKQKTNVELENEIARRVEAEQKLAEANKGLKAFAYVASHDLQEPLRKINTFTSMLTTANASPPAVRRA